MSWLQTCNEVRDDGRKIKWDYELLLLFGIMAIHVIISPQWE